MYNVIIMLIFTLVYFPCWLFKMNGIVTVVVVVLVENLHICIILTEKFGRKISLDLLDWMECNNNIAMHARTHTRIIIISYNTFVHIFHSIFFC